MKKLLTLLICSALVFGLSSCTNEMSKNSVGNGSPSDSTPPQSNSTGDIELPPVDLP